MTDIHRGTYAKIANFILDAGAAGAGAGAAVGAGAAGAATGAAVVAVVAVVVVAAGWSATTIAGPSLASREDMGRAVEVAGTADGVAPTMADPALHITTYTRG